MISDIYKRALALLKAEFPTFKIYESSVIEGMKKPCFFIEVSNQADDRSTINYKNREYVVTITYLQKEKSGADNYQMIDKIDDLFGYKLGSANVISMRHRFIGEEGNLLQMEIELQETQWIERTVTQPEMGNLNLNKEE